MRILIISAFWPPRVMGGSELYASALAERLEGLGHEVGVLTLGSSGPHVVGSIPPWPYSPEQFETQSRSKRLLFHAVDLQHPMARRRIDHVLDTFRPDVVHSHGVQGMSAAVLAAPDRRDVAHVHHLHDYWLLCQRNNLVRRGDEPCETRCRSCSVISRIRREQLVRHGPQVVIAVSEAIAREHATEPWLRARLRVLYNPVEVPTTDRAVLPGKGFPLTFGYLGRLATYKGVGTLLNAFTDAFPAPGAARLVVAGRGPLEDATRRAGAAGVEYAGWVSGEEKARLLDRVDCLVVPSEWKDPAPIVVNEARARGIPLVGARIGGIPELIAPECAALLFEPRDRAALTERLQRFAAAPEKFRPEPAIAPLGWEEHLELLLGAYRDAGEHAEANRAVTTRRGRGR